jgi:hypothetical protein
MAFLQKYLWGSVDGGADTRPPCMTAAYCTSESGEPSESRQSQLHSNPEYGEFNSLTDYTVQNGDHGMKQRGLGIVGEQKESGERRYQAAGLRNQQFKFANQDELTQGLEGDQATGHLSASGGTRGMVQEPGSRKDEQHGQEMEDGSRDQSVGLRDEVRVLQQELGSRDHEEPAQESGFPSMGFVKSEPYIDDALKYHRNDHGSQENRMASQGDMSGRMEQKYGDGVRQHQDEEMGPHIIRSPVHASESSATQRIKNEPGAEGHRLQIAGTERSTHDSTGYTSGEVASPQRIQMEPGPDEQAIKELQNALPIHEQNDRYAHLPKGNMDNLANTAAESVADPHQIVGYGAPDIMDVYRVEAMNGADIGDQMVPQDVASSFGSGSIQESGIVSGPLMTEMQPQDVLQEDIGSVFRQNDTAVPNSSTSQLQRKQVPHDISKLECRRPTDSMKRQLSGHAVRGLRGGTTSEEQHLIQQRAPQQNISDHMNQCVSHSVREQEMYNQRRIEQIPERVEAAFQPHAFDGHDSTQERKSRQTPRHITNDNLAYAKGSSVMEEKLRATPKSTRNDSRVRVLDGRDSYLQGPSLKYSQKDMRIYPPHALDTQGISAQWRNNQQGLRLTDFQRPASSAADHINRPDHSNQGPSHQSLQRPGSSMVNHINRLDPTKRGFSQHNPTATSSPLKNNAIVSNKTAHYGEQRKPQPYLFGPSPGHHDTSAFNLFDMNSFGQSPMPFIPLPQEQQQSGYYNPNGMHPHPNEFFYDQSQIANLYQQSLHSTFQHGYHLPGPVLNRPSDNPYASPKSVGKRKAQEIVDVQEHEEEEEESSEDNEPLIDRTRRHHSLKSRSDTTESVLGQECHQSANKRQAVARDNEDIQFMGSKPKQKLALKMPGAKAPRTEPQPILNKAIPLTRSLPQPIPQSTQPSNDEDDAESTEISWKLPTFAIDPQPTDPETEQCSIKVSIPGMVREVVLLSPDHAAQESHLYTHLFLPGQQTLTVQDPDPIVATLNFHTVAIMVLDAYAAFKAGDELTKIGRARRYYDSGAASTSSSSGGAEDDPDIKKEARNADIDEIFFAVIDRWRAGKASNKKSYSLIRGVQEFCDIALDIIYYVHENGLLQEHDPDRVRKERCDKGVKRGPRGQKAKEKEATGKKRVAVSKAQESAGTGKGRGKMAGTAKGGKAKKAKVTIVQPRKKVKTGEDLGIQVTRQTDRKGK